MTFARAIEIPSVNEILPTVRQNFKAARFAPNDRFGAGRTMQATTVEATKLLGSEWIDSDAESAWSSADRSSRFKEYREGSFPPIRRSEWNCISMAPPSWLEAVCVLGGLIVLTVRILSV